jgi:hypothetical protein
VLRLSPFVPFQFQDQRISSTKLFQLQEKRLKKLVTKTVLRLDKRVFNTLLPRVYGIRLVWDNILSKVNGQVSWHDSEKTTCTIAFNLFNLRIYSDSAVIGVIAHEFGHVWEDYQQSSLFRHILERLKLIDVEKRADETAIKWGFKEEVSHKRSEMVLNIKKIPFKKDYSAGEVKEKYTKLSLLCVNCKKKYLGRYYYSDIPYMWCSVVVYDQGVQVGGITSEQPMTDEDMIYYGGYCANCSKENLIIKKRGVSRPFY